MILFRLFDFGMNSSYFSDCVSAIQAGGPENIAVLLEEIEKNIEEIENR